MKAQNIVYGLIALTIAVIITISAVVPIFMDTTKTTDTYRNNGLFFMKEYSDSDEIPTIFWDHTDPNKITVGTDVLELSDNTAIGYSIISDDDFMIRYLASATNVSIQLFGVGNGVLIGASVNDGTDMTISFNSGTVTLDNGTDTVTKTYTTLYTISKTGDWVMKNANDSVYVNGDSDIFVVGRTTLTYGSVVLLNINFNGTIDDGFTDSTVIYPTSGYTLSNFVVDSSAVSDHIDLYQFKKVTFDVTQESSDTSKTATYSQVIVPYEVSAERSIHPDGPTSTIINIIPLIIVAGILLLAIVYFIRRA